MRAVCFTALLWPVVVWATTCGVGDVDLSGLTLPSSATSDYSVKDASGYEYLFNVCGIVTQEPQCRAQKGLICQYRPSDHSLVAVVARWDDTVTWQLEQKTVVGLTANGDNCYPYTTPRTSRLIFVCDPSASVPVFQLTEPSGNVCEYDLTVQTRSACGSSPGSDAASAASSLSGGWIFIIVFLVLLTVYIVGGCLWNKHRHPEAEHYCPHWSFWSGTVALVRDGCRFSRIQLQQKCCPPTEYNAV